MAGRARSRGCAIWIGVALAVLLIAGLVALALVPDLFATAELQKALASHGVTCDARLEANVSFLLDEVEVPPVTCTTNRRVVRVVELLSPATIRLEGLRPVSAHVGSARITLDQARARDDASVDAGGPLMRSLGVASYLGGLAYGAATLARASLPRARIDTLEVLRGAGPFATVRGIDAGGPPPMSVRVAEAQMSTEAGALVPAATVSLRGLTGTATPSDVQLEGDLEVRAQIAGVGSTEQRTRIAFGARGLDGPARAVQWTVQGGI